MKKIVLLSFLGLMSLISFGQTMNQIILDERINREILIGEIDMDGILGPVFGEYYHKEFDSYQAETSSIEKLILHNAPGFTYTIVLGTWCGDTKREVPRMLKVLTEIGVEMENIHLIAVDTRKQAPGTSLESLSILKVPTLIVFHSRKEIGRIVETPFNSIEQDLLEILKL